MVSLDLRLPLGLAAALTFAACGTTGTTTVERPPVSLPTAPAPMPAPVEITVLHYNDFHSHNLPETMRADSASRAAGAPDTYLVGGAANFKGYLDSLARTHPNPVVLYAGDEFQGTPISAMTKGGSQIELLNLTRPTVMTLGNHEFDYGRDTLSARLTGLRVPYVSSNLFDERAGKPFAQPWRVEKLPNGVRLGVIGGMTEDLPILTLPSNITGLRVLPLAGTVRQAIAELKALPEGAPDLIVVLTHVGVQGDSLLAAQVPGIDLIVGGHSHTALFKPVYSAGVPIVQAGSYGRWVGLSELKVDTVANRLVGFSDRLIETRVGAVRADPAIAAVVERQEGGMRSQMEVVLATLADDWRTSLRGESNLGDWASDAIRQVAGTDIAFTNSGGVRKNVLAGPLRMRDMWEISPFDNTLALFTVRGDTLRQMMEAQAAGASTAGSRDRKPELMQVSGMRYTFDPRRPVGSRVTMLQVGGKPVVDTKRYSVVTNNYVASHLADFFSLPQATIRMETRPTIIRDVLIQTARQQRTISSKLDGRIIDQSAATK